MGDNGGGRFPEPAEEEQAEAVDDVAMLEAIRQALLERTLEIGKAGDVNGIFDNAGSFVKLSQGNDTVQNLVLYLNVDYYRDDKTLRKLIKGFGNLEALRVLTIRAFQEHTATRDDAGDGDDDDSEVACWQALNGVLARLRHNIELRLDGLGGTSWEDVDFTNLAVAMEGVSTIQTFHSSDCFSCFLDSTGSTLMSALASLPSLENVTLGSFHVDSDITQANELRGLTNLLKSPSLRSIEFSKFVFTRCRSLALLAAFEEGSFVTDLRFTCCYRGYESDDHSEENMDGTVHALVQALQRIPSVKTLSLVGNIFDELLFCEGVTTALLVNTTLVNLVLRTKRSERLVQPEEDGMWLQPLFIAVRINTSLKSLDVDTFHLTDELVCGALHDALANNSVLESLTLHSVRLDDISLSSWRNTLPFIRGNATLKSLTISFDGDALDGHVAMLCLDSVGMLGNNNTLECLGIKSGGISPDTYFLALESLQPSSTLKTLRLSPVLASMGEEEMKHVVSLVKKNYLLVVLDEGLSARDTTGEVGTLLKLNQAGRRYLIEDTASIAKGVEVLIGVSDDIGCLFYHLLENPTLCDIEYQYSTKSEAGYCAHINKRLCI
jgi:hypothetical protein